jgi:hypothetical protein
VERRIAHSVFVPDSESAWMKLLHHMSFVDSPGSDPRVA